MRFIKKRLIAFVNWYCRFQEERHHKRAMEFMREGLLIAAMAEAGMARGYRESIIANG